MPATPASVPSLPNSELFRALCEPARMVLVVALARYGASDVKTLASGMVQDRSVVSRHLRALERAAIVHCSRDGRNAIYQLDGDALALRLEEAAAAIRSLAPACCPGPAEPEPEKSPKRETEVDA